MSDPKTLLIAAENIESIPSDFEMDESLERLLILSVEPASKEDLSHLQARFGDRFDLYTPAEGEPPSEWLDAHLSEDSLTEGSVVGKMAEIIEAIGGQVEIWRVLQGATAPVSDMDRYRSRLSSTVRSKGEGSRATQKAIDKLREVPGATLEIIDQSIQEGIDSAERLRHIHELATSQGREARGIWELRTDFLEAHPFLIKTVDREISRGDSKFTSQLLRELMSALRKYGDLNHEEVEEALRNAETANLDQERVSTCIERGFKVYGFLNRLEASARHHANATHPVLKTLLHSFDEWLRTELRGEQRYFLKLAGYRIRDGVKRGQRRRERKTASRNPSSVRRGPISHRISSLSPSPSWTLLIDETGQNFLEEKDPEKIQGKFVGLLVPNSSPLPPLDGATHACTAGSEEEIDRLLQIVLDRPVGILGVALDGLPMGGGERWVTGVLEVVHWALRLMPIKGATKIDVMIENRGPYRRDSDWRALFSEVQRNLSEYQPKRYRHVQLKPRVIGKNDHPLNGYVDVIAFTWGSPSHWSQDRLAKSGLLGKCLHSGKARQLRSAWDRLQRGIELTVEQWRAFVDHPHANVPGSIPHAVLTQLGESVREDSRLWRRWVQVMQEHLESKAVNLSLLQNEIRWLQRWHPSTEHLPAPLRLAWLSAELELRNQHGHAEVAFEAEFDKLGFALLDEAPTLVCQADLNRAVCAINRFEIDIASAHLEKWREEPPRSAGLLHWGRVQSALGQHAAFRRRYNEAEEFFTKALSAFQRLSSAEKADTEGCEASTYRALNAIDQEDCPNNRVRELVQEVLSLDLKDIVKLSKSSDNTLRTSHHLLLRYLFEEGNADEKAAYLSQRVRWKHGTGHPWQLIEGYRGLLLVNEDPKRAAISLRKAWQITLDQGPAIRFVGVVFGVIAQSFGSLPCVEISDLIYLQKAIPSAQSKIAKLAHAASNPHGWIPRELITEMLPFRFR